jgi:hypothetical protein
MSLTLKIEEELRSRLERELQGHQDKLSEIQKQKDELDALYADESAQLDHLRLKIEKFDSIFGTEPEPSRRPVVSEAVPTARTVSAPSSKPSKPPNNNRAAVGRREVADGRRPKIRDAMVTVMGTNIMNALSIYEDLKVRDWLPNSSNPRAYIAYLLSSFSETFERVPSKGRGYYRVRATATAEVLRNGVPQLNNTDEILRDAGVLPAN